MTRKFNTGAIVKARDREWIVVPSDREDVLMLKPLGGSELETCGIYLPLNLEQIESASFPLPEAAQVTDLERIRLLITAMKMSFRSGAGPFRALGKISVRLWPYQLIPLLMALRQDVVRLLIADDVGVGKTVEGLIVARELLDRGEVRSIGVLCPPHLCEQWQHEMSAKFNLEPAIIKSGTISQLERNISDSVFEHYPFFVASIDFLKADKRKSNFLQHLPDLVIIDEAHTCTKPVSQSRTQQLRFELSSEIAESSKTNLILLTATPHNGNEDNFKSLVGLLNKDFITEDFANATPELVKRLAKFFVQRSRKDIELSLGTEMVFPERETRAEKYSLSDKQSEIFKKGYDFLLSDLKTADDLEINKRRVKYWGALVILSAIMSSPAAGLSSIDNKASKLEKERDATIDRFKEATEDNPYSEISVDDDPGSVLRDIEEDLTDSDHKILQDLRKLISSIKPEDDFKLKKLAKIVKELLSEGYKPVIFCKFKSTAKYLEIELRKNFKSAEIKAITSEHESDQRQVLVKQLIEQERRILVATDCLSEGINLQSGFDAIIHYDLPWNPNRLEQREGRVDRFGQKTSVVKTILLYGADNPIDGKLLQVLTDKSITIHKTLGVKMPVPVGDKSVMSSIVASLFVKKESDEGEYMLDFGPQFEMDSRGVDWDRTTRQKSTVTKFAQHAIKPEEVSEELEETDKILGSPDDVRYFVTNAYKILGGSVRNELESVILDSTGFGEVLKPKIKNKVKASFNFPNPEGTEEIGRNHYITSSLAEYIVEASLIPDNNERIGRCAVLRTAGISTLTILFFLRVRYVIRDKKILSETMSEEMLPLGFSLPGNSVTEIGIEEVNHLISKIDSISNVSSDMVKEYLEEGLKFFRSNNSMINQMVIARAEHHRSTHHRLRRLSGEGSVEIQPHLPVDLLSLVVLLPQPKGAVI